MGPGERLGDTSEAQANLEERKLEPACNPSHIENSEARVPGAAACHKWPHAGSSKARGYMVLQWHVQRLYTNNTKRRVGTVAGKAVLLPSIGIGASIRGNLD